jgi:uroporphyrinogen decarboxylase
MWFHPQTARRLARLLEIPPSRVAEAMGDDIRQTWVNNNYAMEGIVHDADGERHEDWWGVGWVKQYGFNQIERFPLAGAPRERVLAYEFPMDRFEELLALMLPVLRERGEYWIGCDVSPCVFEMYWRLRGMEDAMLDIGGDPELADAMFARCADFSIALGEAACERYSLDWFWTGDDVGGQQGMMLSPRSWRQLVKPHLTRVFEVGRNRGLPIAYHCCGALRPIIPDLIEMGLDVLNPVQCNCPGMDPKDLKHEFGSRIAFMGGVDTQDLLPNGTPAEVRRATRELIETMTADDGGYILAASHTISPETPDENIFAMYEAAGLTQEEICDRAAAIRARTPQARKDSLV